MSIYKPPNSENWYISISHQGRRIRESAGTPDRQAAQEYHDKYKADLWREDKLNERFITFEEACAYWLKAQERGKTDRYGVRTMVKLLAAGTSLREVNQELIAHMLSDKSPATKRRYINLVSAICRLSGYNPDIKRPVIKEGRIRWLTKAEWLRLKKSLKLVSPHLGPVSEFAISTGLRMSNILTLEWSQCDLPRKLMWVHPDQSKSGKPISVPLSLNALKVLNSQSKCKVGDGRYVFPYYNDGTPIARVSNHGWYAAKKANAAGALFDVWI